MFTGSLAIFVRKSRTRGTWGSDGVSLLRRLRNDERGISSVIAAFSLVALFGAAVLSLDAGNVWQTRRNIVTATDAAALEQARTFSKLPGFAGSGVPCPITYTDYLLRNGGAGTEPIGCTAHYVTSGTGYVTVEARKAARTRFGGLFGIGDTSPYSMSAAMWGFVSKVDGLRPMGLCSNNGHFREWIAFKTGLIDEAAYLALRGTEDVGTADGPDPDPYLDPPRDGKIDYPTYPAIPGVVHRVYFTTDSPDECPSVPGEKATPGNWGWMDFNGGSNADPELIRWIRYGYSDNPVGVNDCDGDAGTPGGESGDTCNGTTGSRGGSVEDALEELVDNQTKFAIPIYDTASGPGNNAQFGIYAFVGVILRGFEVNGAESRRYFDFDFVDLQLSGNCCISTAPSGVDTGIRGIKICAVDHDTKASQTVATRCG